MGKFITKLNERRIGIGKAKKAGSASVVEDVLYYVGLKLDQTDVV